MLYVVIDSVQQGRGIRGFCERKVGNEVRDHRATLQVVSRIISYNSK